MTDLLILNLYFPPDRAATGMLLGQLYADLKEKYSVSVLCGSPTYNPESTPDKDPNVHRIPLLPWSRGRIFARLLNYALFTVGATFQGLARPKAQTVMAWTDPPWISWSAWLIAKVKRSKLVLVCQDVYPEIAFAIRGTQPNPFLKSWLLKFFSFPLRRADTVVVIGEDMKRVLEKKGVLSEKIEIIENWQDEKNIIPHSGRAFRQAQGWTERDFVVMHSGNIGFSQNLDLLLRAAKNLLHETHFRFALIGDGAQKPHLQEWAKTHGLSNVSFLPYQPTAMLSESLGAADVHYVSLREAFCGLIVPSKVYGIMAAGKAMISTLPMDCALSKKIRALGCGHSCDPNPDELSAALVAAFERRHELAAMGAKGRAYLERHGGRQNALAHYTRVLFT